MQSVDVSIIIPIYNCEKYLEQCLNSAMSQSVEKKEIICIDDGSTDGSAEIIKRYCCNYSNIVYILQDNSGAGMARNRGLKEANGKYVSFLDADDYYLDKNALDNMIRTCEKKRVKACGGLMKLYENNEETNASPLHCKYVKGRELSVVKYNDVQLDYDYFCFIFERKSLLDSDIIFPHYRRYQDPVFLVRALYNAKEFAVVNSYLYCYRVPMISERFNVSKIKDLLYGLKDNLTFALDNNLEILFERTLTRLEYEYGDLILSYFSQNDLELWRILFEINDIVISNKSERDSIRLIKKICELIKVNIDQYENNLLRKLEEASEIAIYGAGKYGLKMKNYLDKHHFIEKLNSFLVSDGEGDVGEIPICDIKKWSNKEALICVAVYGINQKDIEQLLEEYGFSNYELLNMRFLETL